MTRRVGCLVGVILSIIVYLLKKLLSGTDSGAADYWRKGYEAEGVTETTIVI
ncbi:MAG: hypothetical protein KBG12_08755 [Syntrophobacterales bacterium]|nr:hypothetical protein [Syntrophobacterales bacterium]